MLITKLELQPFLISLYYVMLFKSYSIVPFVNPLIPMFIISAYRHSLFQFVARLFGKIYLQPTVSTSGGPNASRVHPIPLTNL